jgi:hypothetical protein
MNKERREIHTEDLARPHAASDRVAVERDPVVAGGEPFSRPASDAPAPAPERAMLFREDEAGQFHSRWTEVQGAFVDSPRSAVERADSLVAETMKRLAEVFSEERAKLEAQWDRGDNVTTEDLRVALQRYRAFFDRLLNI